MSEEDPYYGLRPVAPTLLGTPGLWEPVEKHASALGWAVISWCQLYEELALLFGEIVGNGSAALAAWHQVRNDRTQRQMLRAALEESLDDKPVVRDHLLWALNQMQSMEDRRNDAVHAPVQLVLDAAGIVFVPMEDTGNPRAAKLAKQKDLDLEIEFRRQQSNSDALRSFIRTLRGLARPGVRADDLPPKPQLLSYEQAIAQRRERASGG